MLGASGQFSQVQSSEASICVWMSPCQSIVWVPLASCCITLIRRAEIEQIVLKSFPWPQTLGCLPTDSLGVFVIYWRPIESQSWVFSKISCSVGLAWCLKAETVKEGSSDPKFELPLFSVETRVSDPRLSSYRSAITWRPLSVLEHCGFPFIMLC